MHQIQQFQQNEWRRSFWRVRFFVAPTEVGYLYRRNRLEKKLPEGIYDFFDFKKVLRLVALPRTTRIQTVVNQEVLSKDNIALRFSFFVEYRISDTDLFLEKFNVFANPYYIFTDAEQLIHNLAQAELRREISTLESEELNEKRNDILPEIPDGLRAELGSYGIEIVRLLVRDLTFPKSVQDMLARALDAKVRARTDLENARTQVAAARALKNASELMKGDEDMRFLQFLETVSNIAEKGKHTFVIGDLQRNAVNLKKDRNEY